MSTFESRYPKIEELFNLVRGALFDTTVELSYTKTMEGLEALANQIINTKTEEDVWNIGEYGECTLNDLIIGSYVFLTHYHGGQDSLEYRVLSALGNVFDPGLDSIDEESSEQTVYDALENLWSKEFKGVPKEGWL